MDLKVFNARALLEAADEMEFLHLSQFGAGAAGAFWSNSTGQSPWEMHPDCDELLTIMEGRLELEVLPPDGGTSQLIVLAEGDSVVVPQGCWHRQVLVGPSKEFYLTPGKTLHSAAADPRQLDKKISEDNQE